MIIRTPRTKTRAERKRKSLAEDARRRATVASGRKFFNPARSAHGSAFENLLV